MSQAGKRRSVFAGTFVNEMYAILLGIGMGSVVFGDDFSLTDVTGLASVTFVLVVVLVYWWDWADSIQHHVVSTFRELTLDLLFGFVFLLLFHFYRSPVDLAKTLIALAALDVLWIVNFWATKETRLRLTTRRALLWIASKLAAVAVYVGALLAAWYLAEHFSKEWSLLAVLIAFILVRALFFRDVGGLHRFRWRQATADDVNEILRIHNAHALSVRDESAPRGGFLLCVQSPDSIRRAIETRARDYFIVTTGTDLVAGFVAVQDSLPDAPGTIRWNNKRLEEWTRSPGLRHVDAIAVAPEFQGFGVADFIYQKLFASAPAAVFTAFVALAPVTNARSLRFHLRHGFVSAGSFTAPEFEGLADYRSELLIRSPHDHASGS